MKKLFSLVGCALLAISAYALAPQLTINGQEVQQTLTSITFDGDNVVVHFGDEQATYDMESVTITFPWLSDVKTLTFHDLKAAVNGSTLMVGGIDAKNVQVYDLSGVQRAQADVVDGNAAVDIDALPSGVYMLRAGKACVKFIKR